MDFPQGVLQMAAFKMYRKTAVGLLVELGYPNADKYPDSRIVRKLSLLTGVSSVEISTIEDRHLSRVLTSLMTALNRGDALEIVSDAEAPSRAIGAPPLGRPRSDRGVIATIIKCLQKATYERPVTKVDILAVLKMEFPDRNPASMAVTLDKQVMSVLRSEGYDIRKCPRGFWIAMAEMEKAKF